MRALVVAGCLLPWISGCDGRLYKEPLLVALPPIEAAPLPEPSAPERLPGVPETPQARGLSVRPGAAVPAPAPGAGAEAQRERLPELGTQPLSVTLDQVPLPAFINAVFGELLRVDFQVHPDVAQRTEVITLRTATPKTPRELLALTRQVLETYGIQVTYRNGVFQILPDEALRQMVPRVLRSRAHPEVPIDLRPLFQYVTLRAVEAANMIEWLREAFGERLTVREVPGESAVLLFGLPNQVNAALDMIQALDQPRFAGQVSARLEPTLWTAGRLATRLVEVLRVEGYNAATQPGAGASIVLLPIEPINAIIAFAPDAPTLNHIIQWARDFDQPAAFGQARTLFYYPVQNTRAQTLAEVINRLLAGGLGAPEQPAGVPAAAGAAPAEGGEPVAAEGQPSPGPGGGVPRVVVDPYRNALIFTGTAEAYAQIRTLLEAMDRAVREALIEVMVAEVTLTDETALGIEWTLKTAGIDDNDIRISTLGGLGIGTRGLNFTVLSQQSEVRAILNAFASNDNVSILSSPRLLSRSGGEARIEVGTEVPIVTSQATAPDLQQDGTTSILQQIQYRNTGVILTIRPIIHAGRRIDLEIAQEVSEAQENTTSTISSPLILNRRIQTQLSLLDGSTVLLGGLISENRSRGETGIPVLADIPGIGVLFRQRRATDRRTELIIMITPYVVETDEDALRVTRQFRNRLGPWAVDAPPSGVIPPVTPMPGLREEPPPQPPAPPPLVISPKLPPDPNPVPPPGQ